MKKYYKSYKISVSHFIDVQTTLFFVVLNIGQKKKCAGNFLYYFIQHKSGAKAHVLIGLDAAETMILMKIKIALAHWKSLRTKNSNHYFMKTYVVRRQFNLQNHFKLNTQQFRHVTLHWEWFKNKDIAYLTSLNQ